MTATKSAVKTERRENAVQIVILLVVGLMAGAASFTHVHDWTMDNSPAGTGDWFGWANAVISELTPLGAGIEVRRRRRAGHPIAYPLTVLMAAALLSLAAQVAVAKPSASGWLLFAVPALAFLALTKLVLGRPTTTPAVEPVQLAPEPATVPAERVPEAVELPADLVMGARMAAFSHQQATGAPITGTALAERLNLPQHTAAQLLAAIAEPAPLVAANTVAVNGTHYPNGVRS